MKKIFLSLCVSLVLVSCSKNETKTAETSVPMLEEPVAEVETAVDPVSEGQQLLEGMDCLTCHKTDAKMIGPSYKEVAQKYTSADIDVLADNIINGSVGVWGQVPMTPHNGLSKENAKKMVEYILTLK